MDLGHIIYSLEIWGGKVNDKKYSTPFKVIFCIHSQQPMLCDMSYLHHFKG